MDRPFPRGPAVSSCFFHVDMDAFYASVEQNDHPALRGKPVVVGGRSGRGVVAACSYEARSYGVHSAMPMRQALSLCPSAHVVPVRMHRYREVSGIVMGILNETSPSVQAISIDEAFLDMTGTQRLLGPYRDQARSIKEAIRSRTGLTISVGIAQSRFIAKMASDVDKPDGLFEVVPGEEGEFVLTLPLKDLWGLGKKTLTRLNRLGITTVRQLRDQRIEYLNGHFGDAAGRYLYHAARGEDPGIFQKKGERHSISAEETFEEDIQDPDVLEHHLLLMADEVIHRSIVEGWRGRTIQVKFRLPSFETHTVSRTLSHRVQSSGDLTRIAMGMLESRRESRPLRLLGVGVSGDITDGQDLQNDLIPFTGEHDAPPIDTTIVALRNRFGRSAIGRASFIPTDDGGDDLSDRE